MRREDGQMGGELYEAERGGEVRDRQGANGTKKEGRQKNRHESAQS